MLMVVCLLLMVRSDCWCGDGNGGGHLTVNLMLFEMPTKQLCTACCADENWWPSGRELDDLFGVD